MAPKRKAATQRAAEKKARTDNAEASKEESTSEVVNGRQWALFLRGLNVGSAARVSMDKLRSCVVNAGFGHAKHYLQSGNIVFTAPEDMGAEHVSATLVAALREIGLEPECIMRSKEDLQSILARNLLSDIANDDSKYLVHLFNEEPESEQKAAILEPFECDSEGTVMFDGRELFVWCPNGISKSPYFKLKFEKMVPGNMGTGRNWRTLKKVRALMDD
ncbi:hypothetical protein EXIGLDRAFT_827883 [Exidia glandulosa HHB12029]|uniref:DUF1697-domain-containing protein n=1 Tax=Exidia glandulosa HHB12029 TaxID=1314781 RepID=A0A165QQP7_EXIGL|nr:hypothetical protein EXIGLDRAFT_827883 [Exidia glandulosa HHB12029]